MMPVTFEPRRRGRNNESRIHDVWLNGSKIGGVRKVRDDEWSGWLNEEERPLEPEREEVADSPELAFYHAIQRELNKTARRQGDLYALLQEAEALLDKE